MEFRTLISTDALAHPPTDAHLVIVDCRTRRIPGAVYAHLGHDLADVKT
jgi:hypothetical protein